MLRQLFQTSDPSSQPFVVSGSGTLGWDMVAANLVEPGDEVLVLHTGYFGDGFADCFETYGVKPTQLKAPIGSRPQLPEIEQALRDKKYKMITVTHVDTSTGVLSEVQPLAELVRRVSPDTLIVVDGVCSVGSEEICFDDWGLDVVLTASQKGVGCPAGLSIMMVSGRAMQRFKDRTVPPGSYFGSFKNWLPSMQALPNSQNNASEQNLWPSALLCCIRPYAPQYSDSPLTAPTHSNAILRVQKTRLLRNSFSAVDPRATHVPPTDPHRIPLPSRPILIILDIEAAFDHRTPERPFRGPSKRVSSRQGRDRERTRAETAGRASREPGEWHDGLLHAGRRAGGRSTAALGQEGRRPRGGPAS